MALIADTAAEEGELTTNQTTSIVHFDRNPSIRHLPMDSSFALRGSAAITGEAS